MLFLSVRGFSDYAGPTVHSRLAWLPCCLPLTRNEVGILIYGLFAAQSPRPPMPLSTLQETPRDVPSKIRGQDGFASRDLSQLGRRGAKFVRIGNCETASRG